ncbi:MAG: hypothetical protein JRJ65_11685 [Deltaproteobacteria bacterium]|nr:hypothetical protein [Deltaproteobacteria bacterium]
MRDDYIYSEEDIYHAYDRGLETAIIVLERSIRLSPEGQLLLIDRLKESIFVKKTFEKSSFLPSLDISLY